MKVAIIEASHWHVPLYLNALEAEDGVSVIAVSDRERARGPELANRFGATCHNDWRVLLDEEQPDFVFAFGRHADMPDIAHALFDCGIPFAIEKPAGLNADQVSALAERARSQRHFVSVPLIFGFSDLLSALRDHAGAESGWQHMAFRFIAGPVDRYVDSHCDWMLQKPLAGGGCTINLAVHFIDLFRRLTGKEVTSVSARMIEDPAVADVEIYAQLSMRNEAGQLCTVETGYTFPSANRNAQREFSFSLASDTHYIEGRDNTLRCTPRDGTPVRTVELDFETDRFYASFVRQTFDNLRSGRPPFAGLDDLARVMAAIDGAYASHQHGDMPSVIAAS